jgi:hypothetical protein
MTTKKTTKLSQRPLKRLISFEIMLGPYSVAYRDDKERPRQHYILWTSELPKGKKLRRFMSCVQLVNRPGHLADVLHNPILYRRIVQLPNSQDSEYTAKHCWHCAQHALYWLLEGQLKHLTRPMLKMRGTTSYEMPEEWLTIEPGNSEQVLGQWRSEAMYQISSFLGHWKQDPVEPFGYMGDLEPKIGKLTK